MVRDTKALTYVRWSSHSINNERVLHYPRNGNGQLGIGSSNWERFIPAAVFDCKGVGSQFGKLHIYTNTSNHTVIDVTVINIMVIGPFESVRGPRSVHHFGTAATNLSSASNPAPLPQM